MKKQVFVFLAIMAFGMAPLFAQTFLSVNPKDSKGNMSPFKSDHTYSAVYNVSGSKVDLMNSMKSFLANRFGNADELANVKIDEATNEFRFPLYAMEGQSIAKGVMGVKMIAPPVLLKSEAIFTFDDNDPGHVTMTITNFEGAAICFADDDHVLNLTKKSISKPLGLGQYENNEYDKKIGEEGSAILTLGSTIGKLLIVSQVGTDAYAAAVEEQRKKQKEQFDMYEEVMENGSSEMITKENIGKYGLAGFSGKNEKMWIDMRDKYQAGEWVIGMNKGRWDEDFQPYYDQFIHAAAVVMKGSIQSVSQNGEMLFEEFEGKVLPVDPKERKKWIKKDMSY